MRKRRGKEALLACVASKFENAPSAVSLYPRYHQRTISSVSAPPTFRQPPCAGRAAAFLLAYISPLLPAFDVHIVCFDLPAQFREPPFALGVNFALGVKGLSDRLSHPSRSFSRHASFFSNRPCSSALVHLPREVDPASQAYVGGFQKRARRVDKPLAAGNHLPQASQ